MHHTEGDTSMLEMLRRRREDEQGFTLIELMVVVLIIAILIAIAIPTFLGARRRSQNRAAQSNIRNAFTAEKTYYTDQQQYTETESALTAIEPSLDFETNAASLSSSGNMVYVNVSGTNNETVTLGAQSASGDCYWLRDNSTTGTRYSTSTACGSEPADGTFTATKW
jgi:type IV pilus assembly protein PilA